MIDLEKENRQCHHHNQQARASKRRTYRPPLIGRFDVELLDHAAVFTIRMFVACTRLRNGLCCIESIRRRRCGNQRIKVVGPRHKVRFPRGDEVGTQG